MPRIPRLAAANASEWFRTTFHSLALATTWRRVCLAGCAALLASATFVRAHDHAAPAMTSAAQAFLASLSPDQRAEAVFPLTAREREDWGFVPRSRRGVPLKGLSPSQRTLALALLGSVLSARGSAQAEAIIALENVLREIEGASYRDAELYFITIFGEPGAFPWGWRFEGHHLSLNITAVDRGHIVVTPTFFGANPAEVPAGPRKGQRTLADEEAFGRELVKSLDAEQQRVAVIAARAPRDIITGDDRVAKPLSPPGLPGTQMNDTQRAMLDRLLQVYLGRFRDEISAATRERMLASGVDAVHFAWAGGFDPGQGHYYRLQGPSFLIEYDNTQNGANHIHTTFRDFERDFGRDLLREHYERDH